MRANRGMLEEAAPALIEAPIFQNPRGTTAADCKKPIDMKDSKGNDLEVYTYDQGCGPRCNWDRTSEDCTTKYGPSDYTSMVLSFTSKGQDLYLQNFNDLQIIKAGLMGKKDCPHSEKDCSKLTQSFVMQKHKHEGIIPMMDGLWSAIYGDGAFLSDKKNAKALEVPYADPVFLQGEQAYRDLVNVVAVDTEAIEDLLDRVFTFKNTITGEANKPPHNALQTDVWPLSIKKPKPELTDKAYVDLRDALVQKALKAESWKNIGLEAKAAVGLNRIPAKMTPPAFEVISSGDMQKSSVLISHPNLAFDSRVTCHHFNALLGPSGDFVGNAFNAKSPLIEDLGGLKTEVKAMIGLFQETQTKLEEAMKAEKLPSSQTWWQRRIDAVKTDILLLQALHDRLCTAFGGTLCKEEKDDSWARNLAFWSDALCAAKPFYKNAQWSMGGKADVKFSAILSELQSKYLDKATAAAKAQAEADAKKLEELNEAVKTFKGDWFP